MDVYVCSINKEDITIDRAELALRLKTPKDFTDDNVERCIKKVKEALNPKCCYVKVPVSLRDNGLVDFEFASFKTFDLHKSLKGCPKAYILGVTLGAEVDRLINRLGLISKADAFIADGVASAMAESALDIVNDFLKSREKSLCPRFSPGYGDFDISAQREILGALNADRIMGVKLGDNLIMTPRKSITAICGIKE